VTEEQHGSHIATGMINAHFYGYAMYLSVLITFFYFALKHFISKTIKCFWVTLYKVIQNDCRGFNNLPPGSPDATPCDFFLWGYVKDQVYVPPLPASIPELKILPLKPLPLTCYKQFGTNSIIVLMFVESQRVHI